MSHAVIIPVYKENDNTIDLCSRLRKLGADHIVIVNDGCRKADGFFDELSTLGCRIVNLTSRSGKGVSLRAGFEYAENNLFGVTGFITADADGQHSAEDIMRISRAMELRPDNLIIGCRDVRKSSLNLPRRIGKVFSRIYFKIVTGTDCRDTLSGLRGIPATLYKVLVETEGDKFDYEMNFLTKCADMKVPFYNVKIISQAVESGEKSSYRLVRDTYLIYKTPLKFATASLGCTAVDLVLFTVFTLLLRSRGMWEQASVIPATIAARIVSGSINFMINKKVIFETGGKAKKQALRFLILFVCIMCASTLFVTLLSFLPIPSIVIKAVVDLLLWAVNYTMQRKWVFRDDANPKTKTGNKVKRINRTGR